MVSADGGRWTADLVEHNPRSRKWRGFLSTMPMAQPNWYPEPQVMAGQVMRLFLGAGSGLLLGAALMLAGPVGRVAPANASRDVHGDRLPPHAVARLGTVRLRGQLQRGPDGKSLATLRGNRATLVDPGSGAEIKQLPGPDPAQWEATSFLVSPNGELIAYGGADGVQVWDPSGRMRHSIRMDENAGLAHPRLFLPNVSALMVDLAYGSPPVLCLDLATGERRWTYQPPDQSGEAACRTIGLGPDGKSVVVIIALPQAITVHLLATDTGLAQHTLELGGQAAADEVEISNDGRLLLIPENNGEIRRMELPAGRDLGALVGKSEPFGSIIAVSPDNRRIAICNQEGVTICDAETGKALVKGRSAGSLMAPMPGFVAPFSANGERPVALFTSDPSTVWTVQPGAPVWRRFDAKNGRERKNLDRSHRRAIQFLQAVPNQQQVVTAADGDGVYIWHGRTGEFVRRIAADTKTGLFGSPAMVESFALTIDGQTMAMKTDANRIQIWDMATGRVRRSIAVPEGSPSGIAFGPDGKTIALGPSSIGNGEETSIRIYDISDGREVRSIACSGIASNHLCYSRDGRWLAASLSNAEGFDSIDVFQAATGRLHRPLEGPVSSFAFLPLGDLIAYASMEEIIVSELASGGARLRMPLPPGETIDLLAVSPDGRWLAGANNGAGSRKIHLWELSGGTAAQPLIGHDHHITALAFGHDGRLISGSDDTTALIWQLSDSPLTAVTVMEKPDDWAAAWDRLGGDPAAAHQTLERLLATGTPAVEWMKQRLKPAEPIDALRIQRHLERLNADHFPDRQKAVQELEKFDRQAEPYLRKHLETRLSAEARRRTMQLIERLENPAADPEQLRAARCLEFLQRLNNDAARSYLADLAKGDPAARLTQSAREALARSR